MTNEQRRTLVSRRALQYFVVLGALAVSIGVGAAQEPNSIRAEALRAHMRFLADDFLEGRATGTRGFDLAARYVASHLELFGLKPAGDAGTYFQRVPIRRAEVTQSSAILSTGDATIRLAAAIDYAIRPDVRTSEL